MTDLNKRIRKILTDQTKNRTVKKLSDLPQPAELKNCVSAAQEIVRRLKDGQKMLIVGDYDADGILATTIMYSFLKDVGLEADYLIPSRLEDGYGLSPNIIEKAKKGNYDFIVTVDNGIAAVDAIALSNSYGIDVIITDHHTAPKVLPDALITVCPKVPGETFPFIEISGATVAWYVCVAMRQTLDAQIDMRKYLDLVGITVVSDVMPLDNINLALLDFTLKKIRGLNRAVYRMIWRDFEAPYIDETSLGFNLVPMINAIGRINDANIGVKLLTSVNEREISEILNMIKAINEERKELSLQGTKEAMKYIEDNDLSSKKAIVVKGEFHEGIVGIIAGRIAEKFNKPAYVFSFNEENQVWKGSARTSGEIHLYNLTNEAGAFIKGFGGHKGACGMAVGDSQFDDFQAAIEQAAENIPEEDFFLKSDEPILCDLDEVTEDTLAVIKSFAPFGNGNPAPKFQTKRNKGLYVSVERELKNGLHYKTSVKHGKKGKAKTVLFFRVEKEEFLNKIQSSKISMVFTPTISVDWRSKQPNLEYIGELV